MSKCMYSLMVQHDQFNILEKELQMKIGTFGCLID